MPELELPGLTVSRETISRLDRHLALLGKWNPAINLVSPKTLGEGWSRHIQDSAQVLFSTDVEQGHWLDFGTGGGFPGLTCALIAAELRPNLRFTFVESDKRKCTFLSTVLRECRVSASVQAKRIESLPPLHADVVSARAVAELGNLLEYAHPHLSPDGVCVFPKGERYREEIAEAKRSWRFKLTENPSITDPKAAILVLGDIERV